MGSTQCSKTRGPGARQEPWGLDLRMFRLRFPRNVSVHKIPTACRQKAKRYLQAEFILVNPSPQENCSHLTGFEGD